jgi:hypothetical protein
MLTPRVFQLEEPSPTKYPASDVLCHHPGTVSKTSGSCYPLDRLDHYSLARALFRSGFDPCGQSRVCAERFKNNAAHDSEHLSSYLRHARYYPHVRHHLLGCPREVDGSAYPFTHPVCRDAPFKSPSVPFELCRAQLAPFGGESARPEIRPVDDCNNHISKTSTRCLARLPSRCPGLPPMRFDECCGSRRSHSLRPALPSLPLALSACDPAWSSVTSDAPVTVRAAPAY